jgi:lysozyme
MVPGVDLSHYQGDVEWPILQQAGVKFAFLKAMQGTTPDPSFTGHWNYLNSNDFGILKSAYHFYDTSVDPVAQANAFSFVVGALKINDLPPVVDIEKDATNGSQSLQQRIQGLQTFITTIQKKFGKKPIIYTDMAFFKDYFQNSVVFSGYPLFLAEYPTERQLQLSDPIPTFTPRMGCGWSSYTFLQYSQNGLIPGSNNAGNVFDLDVFNGSQEDLVALCNT